jgi:hypothetical protein
MTYTDNSLQNKIFEKHHIQPTYMGGLNYSWNIIKLSYEDALFYFFLI